MPGLFQKKKTEYTGGFATEDMIHAFDAKYSYPDNSPDGKKNIKLSKHLRIGLGKLENDNILVCADPALEHIAVDRIMTNPYGSYVILDRAGEYRKRFTQKFAELDYTVLTLDFSDLESRGRYNPFDYLKTQEDIDMFAERFHSSYVMQGAGDSLARASFALIKMLAYYLLTYKEAGAPTMHSIFIELQTMLPDGIHKRISELSEKYPKEPLAVANALFGSYPDSIRTSTIKGVMSMLFPSEDQPKGQNDTLWLETIGSKKTVLFVTPGQDSPFNRLMCDLLFGQILWTTQTYTRHSKTGTLPQYLRFVLNSRIFSTLWNHDSGQEAIKHSKEYGMSYMVLAERLGDASDFGETQTLSFSKTKSVFAVFLYLGNRMQDTKTMQVSAEYISKISAECAGTALHDAPKRPNTHQCHPMIRTLMTADELRYLRDGWCVCAIPEKIVVYEERANSFRNPAN